MAISAGLFDWPLPETVAKEANRIRILADAGRRYEVGPDLAKELLALLGLVRPFWVPDGVWLVTPERVGFWDNQGVCRISSPLPTPRESGFRLSTFSLQRVLDERTQLWLWTGGQRHETQEVGFLSRRTGDGLSWKSCAPVSNESYYSVERLASGDFVLAGERWTTRYHEDIHSHGACVLSADVGSAVWVDFATRPRGVPLDSPEVVTGFARPFPLGAPALPIHKLHKYLSSAWSDRGRTLTLEAFSCTHLRARFESRASD